MTRDGLRICRYCHELLVTYGEKVEGEHRYCYELHRHNRRAMTEAQEYEHEQAEIRSDRYQMWRNEY